jgi:hypothetical protein
VKTGGCREGRLDALGVVVVVVLVYRGAIEAGWGFRGGREIGGTDTIDILGVAGDNTSSGETDECVCAIAMQDSEEWVVGKGSESNRGYDVWSDPVKGRTPREGGRLRLPFYVRQDGSHALEGKLVDSVEVTFNIVILIERRDWRRGAWGRVLGVGGGRGHRDVFEAGDDGGSFAIVVGVVVVDG